MFSNEKWQSDREVQEEGKSSREGEREGGGREREGGGRKRERGREGGRERERERERESLEMKRGRNAQIKFTNRNVVNCRSKDLKERERGVGEKN